MKKLITICLFMVAVYSLNAQTLKTSIFDDGVGTSAYFSKVDFEISYSIYIQNNEIRIKWTNAKLKVPNDATYIALGTKASYTKVDLGISNWPQNINPSNLNFYVKGSYKGVPFAQYVGNKMGSLAFDDSSVSGIDATDGGPASVTLSSISNARFNQGGNAQLEEIIKQKNKQKSQPANISTTTTQNSGSSNTLSTSSTATAQYSSTNKSITTSQTTTQIPSLESQYAKLGIPANTPTNTKQELTNQMVTQGSAVLGSLVDEMNVSLERREARLDAEYKSKISAESDAKTNKFKIEFLPLMVRAQKGDEEARMILFFASDALEKEYLVEERFQWLEEAIQNNNTDAIIFSARTLLYSKENEAIPLLEKAANLGSSDAMLLLASWYDKKEYLYKSKNGGENEQKALEWYNKAAETGSPKAMFYLGVIYKYGRTLGYMRNNFGSYKTRIKYNIPKNEKLAFDWFSRAYTLSNYKKTPYARAKIEYFTLISDFPINSFTPIVFEELAKIYKEGKVVPKDKEKAKEFETLAKSYKVSIENEAFGETNRYK